MTGDNRNFKHITVTNNPRSSTMYNKALYRDLKQLLVAYDRWPFSDETVEEGGGSPAYRVVSRCHSAAEALHSVLSACAGKMYGRG